MTTLDESSPARVIVLCGLPGSGKTTLARHLAAELGAARLCPDEWISALGVDLYDEPFRARIERLQWTLAEELLALGVSVVIEWGVWSRSERDALRARAHELGAPIELRYLDVPIDELVRRLAMRNADLPRATGAISEADLRAWATVFEAPDAAELASFDPPVR